MNPLLIGSHLLAALLPLILLLVYLSYRRTKQNNEAIQRFWQNQTPEKLQAAGISIGKPAKLPPFQPPFAMLLEGESINLNLQTLVFARQMKIFDYIGAHPGLTLAEIAAHFGFDLPALRIAVELLVAGGALRFEDGGYHLTEAARLYLLDDSPLAMPLPPPVMTEQISRRLRSNETISANRRWGRGQLKNPEVWAIKQHAISFPIGFALAGSGWLAGTRMVLDVAGGPGSVAVALTSQDPDLIVRLIELPGSVEISRKLVSQYHLSGQVECIAQDMFADQPWPGSGELDAVLFTNIFHDWDVPGCRILAEKAFSSVKPGGRIFIQEALLDEDHPGPLWTASLSFSLGIDGIGRQYRLSDLRPILEEAGFEGVEAHPLLGYYSSVTATRP
jgi:SAM-dependent methyltransferase